MASWQSTFKTILSITHYLLETGTLSDVTFVVGNAPNKKSFNAHKLLLSIRSNVFERMFFGALPEKEERIEIPDVSPDIFEIMLKFIYEDKLGLKSMKEAIDTFAVAHKYNITQLMHLSSNYIKNNLNPKNASLVYQMLSIYDEKDLKSACSQLVSENPEEVIQSEAFTQISLETVENVLEIISSNISNHTLLFKSLIKWAKAELERRQNEESTKSLRQLMDSFLPKIKFLSMSSEEFTLGPASSGILTDNETTKIFMNISIPNSAVLPDWCNEERILNKNVVFSLPMFTADCLTVYGTHLKRLWGFVPKTTCKNPFSYEVLCTIQVTERDILLNGFKIFNFTDGLVTLFKINNTEQALHTISPSTDFLNDSKFILKKPFLLREKVQCTVHVKAQTTNYFIQDNSQIGIYSKPKIFDVDLPLSSSGHLKIRYNPIPNPSAGQLPFSELYYSERV